MFTTCFPALPHAGGGAVSLLRQSRHYLWIGLVQWLLDWAVMVALSHLGMSVALANILGRVSGALLGFQLNGRITFANGEGSAVGRQQLARYLAMWVGTTIFSTIGVGLVDQYAGLHWAWLLKPVVDLLAGGIGFLLSRHWIYKT